MDNIRPFATAEGRASLRKMIQDQALGRFNNDMCDDTVPHVMWKLLDDMDNADAERDAALSLAEERRRHAERLAEWLETARAPVDEQMLSRLVEEGDQNDAARAEVEDLIMEKLALIADLSSSRAEVKRLKSQLELLEGKAKHLRWELRVAQLAAERRNRDLDALHIVWCNGGCGKGVHRFCDSPDGVTEDVVALAEKHVKRLRTWFLNRQAKAKAFAEVQEKLRKKSEGLVDE